MKTIAIPFVKIIWVATDSHGLIRINTIKY